MNFVTGSLLFLLLSGSCAKPTIATYVIDTFFRKITLFFKHNTLSFDFRLHKTGHVSSPWHTTGMFVSWTHSSDTDGGEERSPIERGSGVPVQWGLCATQHLQVGWKANVSLDDHTHSVDHFILYFYVWTHFKLRFKAYLWPMHLLPVLLLHSVIQSLCETFK